MKHRVSCPRCRAVQEVASDSALFTFVCTACQRIIIREPDGTCYPSPLQRLARPLAELEEAEVMA